MRWLASAPLACAAAQASSKQATLMQRAMRAGATLHVRVEDPLPAGGGQFKEEFIDLESTQDLTQFRSGCTIVGYVLEMPRVVSIWGEVNSDV
jgi:hypothetical protein